MKCFTSHFDHCDDQSLLDLGAFHSRIITIFSAAEWSQLLLYFKLKDQEQIHGTSRELILSRYIDISKY